MTIFGNRLRGFESVRGRIVPYLYLLVVAINTVRRYRTACDMLSHTVPKLSQIIAQIVDTGF